MKKPKSKPARKRRAVDQAARKVVTRSGQWKKGIVNCPLLPAPVQHESALEKSFIQRAILCLLVGHIRHQPYRIGQHTLDFELKLHTFKIAVEVKLAQKVPNYIAVFNNTAARLAEKGIRFYVLTEREIRAEHRDEHAAEVLRYAKTRVTLVEHARVLDALIEHGSMTAERLQALTGVDAQALQHMVARRLLTCEPTFVVDQRSLLRAVDVPEDPVAFFEAYFGVKPWMSREERAPTPRAKHRSLKRRPKRVGPVLRRDKAYDAAVGMRLLAGGA